jgi:hypothetical protein
MCRCSRTEYPSISLMGCEDAHQNLSDLADRNVTAMNELRTAIPACVSRLTSRAMPASSFFRPA